MRLSSSSISARWLLVPAVLLGMTLTLGCRRTPKQTDSPTPLPDSLQPNNWQFDSDYPTYPELPPPSPNLQPIPPLPEAAALRPYDAHEEFGGFTTRPSTQLVAGTEDLPEFDDGFRLHEFEPDTTPELPGPFETEFTDQAAPSLPPSPSLDMVAPLLPSDDLLANDNLLGDVAVPLAVALRTRSSDPVSLDPLQFVIDLEHEPQDAETTPSTPSLSAPQMSLQSSTTELPRIQGAPEISRSRSPSVLEWPQSGLPHGMVISPGPTTEKWAPRQVAIDVLPVRPLPPQRLSDVKWNWESSRTE